MNFDEAHEQFLHYHLEQRSGERKGALMRGNGYGNQLFLKNVWWPMFGSFDDLHPEYEVYDYNRRRSFIDFAIVKPYYKIAIEIDGFTTHIVEMDRAGFCREVNRQSFLVGMGWHIFRCAFDDIKHSPEVCKQLLQLIMGNFQPSSGPVDKLTITEKEIIRLACSMPEPIRPSDVAEHFGVDFRTARKWIQRACDKQWLTPVVSGKGERVRYYELNATKMRQFW